jgi:hypothetical protein
MGQKENQTRTVENSLEVVILFRSNKYNPKHNHNLFLFTLLALFIYTIKLVDLELEGF